MSIAASGDALSGNDLSETEWVEAVLALGHGDPDLMRLYIVFLRGMVELQRRANAAAIPLADA